MLHVPLASRAIEPARRAFTLVEMLVVVGIILLVVSLSLPSILSARKSSQIAVGAAQMKSLNDMLIGRAMERKGRFLTIGDSSQAGQTGVDIKVEFLFHSAPRFDGEGFAAYWYSYLLATDPGSGLKQDAAFSPADGDVRASAASAGDRDTKLFPGSFYYSPTMFKSWNRYDFTSMTPLCCPSPYGPMYRGDCCDPPPACTPRRCGFGVATLEQLSFPDSKAILFERADFMQPSRAQNDGSAAGGDGKTRPLPPAWNNPKARPHVAFGDASVATVSVSALTSAAADSIRSDPQLSLVPVDLLAVPDALPVLGYDSMAAIDLPGRTDGLYPYFFAGTRYGVRGRDITPDARK